MFGTADTSRPTLPPSLTNIERPDPIFTTPTLNPTSGNLGPRPPPAASGIRDGNHARSVSDDQ